MMSSDDQTLQIGGGGTNSSTTAPSRCKDCGNQAKRDCEHLRCRTCCRSRGFLCDTHVKSTWVPVAARRRPRGLFLHRHHHTTSTSIDLHHQFGGGSNPKRCRSRETVNPAGALGCEAGGGDFPGEVSVPAVFRCVRMSSADEMVNQYAYQTSVRIGGRMFSGILYDQGPEPEGLMAYVGRAAGSSTAAAGIELFQNPNFGIGTASNASGTIPFPHFLGPL